MASSSNPIDHETDTEDDREETSEFVVTPEELREGDFKTLDDARDAIDADSE